MRKFKLPKRPYIYPLISFSYVVLLVSFMAFLGYLSSGFLASEQSFPYEAGTFFGFFGSVLSSCLVLFHLVHGLLSLCFQRWKIAALSILVCVPLFYGGSYAWDGYMKFRGNPCRWHDNPECFSFFDRTFTAPAINFFVV